MLTFGTLQEVDEETKTWKMLQYARLRVHIPNGTMANKKVDIKINGSVHTLTFEEESFPKAIQGYKCVKEYNTIFDNNSTMTNYVN